MHEWGHIYGYDGSRNFTDALTEFLASIIKERHGLDEVEKQWNEESSPRIHVVINNLSNEQKTQLLKSIPVDELVKLLQKEEIDI